MITVQSVLNKTIRNEEFLYSSIENIIDKAIDNLKDETCVVNLKYDSKIIPDRVRKRLIELYQLGGWTIEIIPATDNDLVFKGYWLKLSIPTENKDV